MTTNISTISLLTQASGANRWSKSYDAIPRGAAYLSGPMTVLHRKSRESLLAYAWKMSWFECQLVKREWIVFNPYASCLHPGNFDDDMHAGWVSHDSYLMESAKLLVSAGKVDRAIWLGCPGWRDSNGAQQEMSIARELGMELIEWRWRYGVSTLHWNNVAFISVK